MISIMSSSRIDPLNPGAYVSYMNKKSKSQKHLPTMDKEFKLMNRINELPQRINSLNESIALRRQFLQNQKFKNLENESFRLLDTLRTNRVNTLRDGQFRYLSLPERGQLHTRFGNVLQEMRETQPITGAQARYKHI